MNSRELHNGDRWISRSERATPTPRVSQLSRIANRNHLVGHLVGCAALDHPSYRFTQSAS